jgi:hypothetical protein
LLDNRLYFQLGGTFRRDNLSGSLDDTYGTTRNNTFLGQVAWFPLENLPRADLAVQYETRKNPGAVVNDSLDYRTDLHGLNLNLRLSWDFGIRQRANRLSLDFSNYHLQDLVEGPLHNKQSSQSGFFQLGIRSQLNDRLVNQGFLFWNRSTFTGSDPSKQLGLRNQIRYQWPRGNFSSQGEIQRVDLRYQVGQVFERGGKAFSRETGDQSGEDSRGNKADHPGAGPFRFQQVFPEG